MPKRKILYSAGYGAGWSSWNSGEVAKYMLTYQPIIDFLESGGKFTDKDCHNWSRTNGEGTNHPLLEQLSKDCKEKFGEDYICVLGADGLKVAEVLGQIKIDAYDGYETICHRDDNEGWM